MAAHEHEVVFRGRGGSPTDIDNVVTTCAQCHHDLHRQIGGYRKRMEGTRKAGFRFWERRGQMTNGLGKSEHIWVEVTR